MKIIISGGEDFQGLMNQKEDKEFYTFQPGFLNMLCDSRCIKEHDRSLLHPLTLRIFCSILSYVGNNSFDIQLEGNYHYLPMSFIDYTTNNVVCWLGSGHNLCFMWNYDVVLHKLIYLYICTDYFMDRYLGNIVNTVRDEMWFAHTVETMIWMYFFSFYTKNG